MMARHTVASVDEGDEVEQGQQRHKSHVDLPQHTRSLFLIVLDCLRLELTRL